MAQVLSTLCLTANICLTAAPDVDISAWLGPTYPGAGAGSAGPRLKLCVLRTQIVLQGGRGTGEGPSFQILPDGNGDSTTRKRSTGVKPQLPENPLFPGEPISPAGHFRGCSAGEPPESPTPLGRQAAHTR